MSPEDAKRLERSAREVADAVEALAAAVGQFTDRFVRLANVVWPEAQLPERADARQTVKDLIEALSVKLTPTPDGMLIERVDGTRVAVTREPGETTVTVGCDSQPTCCDHCGKPERFNVLCPDCEALVCLECGCIECCCDRDDPDASS